MATILERLDQLEAKLETQQQSHIILTDQYTQIITKLNTIDQKVEAMFNGFKVAMAKSKKSQ